MTISGPIRFGLILLFLVIAAPLRAGINVWTQSLPDWEPVICFAISPRVPGTIYAGTDRGVFKSIDGGETWRSMNRGMTCMEVFS